MQSDAEEVVSVRTSTPLRRAGLERAIVRAGLGLAVEGRGHVAAITLRTSDDPPTDAPVDISVGTIGTHLTVRTGVRPETWAALGRVIQELMATTQ